MPTLPQLQQFQAPLYQPATMRLQAMEMQNKTRQVDMQEHLLKMKQLEQGKQFIPSLTKEEYPKFKAWVSGLDEQLGNLLPDTAPDNFEDYKQKLYLGADNLTKMNIEQYKSVVNSIEKQKDRDAAMARVKEQQKGKSLTSNELYYKAYVENDPNAKKVVDAQVADKIKQYQAGREVFRRRPYSAVPGVFTDSMTGEFFKTNPGGKPTPMTREEVEKMALEYKQKTPTAILRTMKQSAHTVENLVADAKDALAKVSVGPFAGRWQELWSGKVGLDNPDFIRLRTVYNLLTTRLMHMHVGARGGPEMMKHFEKVLSAGLTSRDNMKAALGVVDEYANDVLTSDIWSQSTKANPEPTETNPEQEVEQSEMSLDADALIEKYSVKVK